jgi:hypothetical protein
MTVGRDNWLTVVLSMPRASLLFYCPVNVLLVLCTNFCVQRPFIINVCDRERFDGSIIMFAREKEISPLTHLFLSLSHTHYINRLLRLKCNPREGKESAAYVLEVVLVVYH